ncbi:hypothetical protein [uncultured Parabacteroides sp.]|uniref:hypothetical protein n=1 Tax=uncultured Parabacteroides sp. TaxID=512312 RepID=UPI0028040383|nr:hypothetical protein [uncultured Parabacteroides sp.]
MKNIHVCHLDQRLLNEAIELYRLEIDNSSSFSYRSFEKQNVQTVLSLLERQDFEYYLLGIKLYVNSSIKIYNLKIDKRLIDVLGREKVNVVFSFSTLYTEFKMIYCEPHNLWTDFFMRICLGRESFTGMDLIEDILHINGTIDRNDLVRKITIVITKLLLMQYLYIELSGDAENHIE